MKFVKGTIGLYLDGWSLLSLNLEVFYMRKCQNMMSFRALLELVQSLGFMK